jgi:hypothetical protein
VYVKQRVQAGQPWQKNHSIQNTKSTQSWQKKSGRDQTDWEWLCTGMEEKGEYLEKVSAA